MPKATAESCQVVHSQEAWKTRTAFRLATMGHARPTANHGHHRQDNDTCIQTSPLIPLYYDRSIHAIAAHLGFHRGGEEAVLQQAELLHGRHLLQPAAVLPDEVAGGAHKGVVRGPPLQPLHGLGQKPDSATPSMRGPG